MSRLTPESIRASQAELPPIGTGPGRATQKAPPHKRGDQDPRSLSYLKANSLTVEVMADSPMPCLLPRWI